MPTIVSTSNSRSARLGFRATPEQEAVIRRAAEVAHKSLTDFILQSAYSVAEQTLLDQRLFVAPGSRCQELLELLELLDRHAKPNDGLRELFSRKDPWEPR